MSFDFSTFYDRHGHDALAVDFIPLPDEEGISSRMVPASQVKICDGLDAIPMWVADMNFPACPSITSRLEERISHPLYGYYAANDEYFNAIIDWQKSRHGIKDLQKEHIGYENGVLGGLMSALSVLCSPGDAILVHSPTYIGFTGSMANAGYHMVLSLLKKDENDIWRMDFEDMEQKIRDNHIHTLVFCSPHNPCGRVWEKEELEQLSRLCEKYDVQVISDEIWSDIVRPEMKHIPTQQASPWLKDNTIAFYAPSKTFSLAGLIGSYHIIYNPRLADRMNKESSLSHYNSMNVLSMHALIGAYSKMGSQWVDEMRKVIASNVDYACDYIRTNFEGVSVTRPQGTYMIFLDCEKWCKKHGLTMQELLQAGIDCGIIWQDGRPFHGPYAIRMNLALPFEKVQEAFSRLNGYVFNA